MRDLGKLSFALFLLSVILCHCQTFISRHHRSRHIFSVHLATNKMRYSQVPVVPMFGDEFCARLPSKLDASDQPLFDGACNSHTSVKLLVLAELLSPAIIEVSCPCSLPARLVLYSVYADRFGGCGNESRYFTPRYVTWHSVSVVLFPFFVLLVFVPIRYIGRAIGTLPKSSKHWANRARAANSGVQCETN